VYENKAKPSPIPPRAVKQFCPVTTNDEVAVEQPLVASTLSVPEVDAKPIVVKLLVDVFCCDETPPPVGADHENKYAVPEDTVTE
jgi:hypothetical protein